MPEGIEAAFAMELARVFALENRIVEHLRRADEINAVLSDVLLTARFLPLEHDALIAAHSATQYYLAAAGPAGKQRGCAHCAP